MTADMVSRRAVVEALEKLFINRPNASAFEACSNEATTLCLDAIRALPAVSPATVPLSFRDAADAVCPYCAGHTPPFSRVVDGPNGAGNYCHEQLKGGTPVLCKASGLWALQRWHSTT